MRQEAFLEIKPDALDGVEFGRVGRQRRERDVGRYCEVVGAMPARLIQDHGRMVILGESFRKAVQEGLHRRRIRIGHHQCEGVVRARLHGSEDVGEGETLVAKPRRTLPALPPDVTDAPLLADARLVLEEQPQALVFMSYTDGL